MALVAANGMQFEVESFGNAADPAVLLIMGLGMQLISWPDAFCRRVARPASRAALRQSRYRTLVEFASTKRPNVPLETMPT